MNKISFTSLLLVSYLATFLRFYINNNILISVIGCFLYGFVFEKTLSKSKSEFLLTVFCSCFTSFSGFIHILYQFVLQGFYFKLFIYCNLIVISNLITMYLGFLLSRKMT